MKHKKGGLGKGLDALFENRVPITEDEDIVAKNLKKQEIIPSGESVVYVDINNVKPNENQPRKVFNSEKISELASSIVEHGIIQPLVLRKISSDRYEIVAGERRWRAAREAGLKKVPSIIREFTDEENMVIAIIENMQREDLNAIEEAEGLRQMIETYGLTQEEVSKSVSKSRPYITNSLRLLKLPASVQQELSLGRISPGHGRALLAANDSHIQEMLCSKIIKEGLSVRKTEELASAGKPKPKLKKVKKRDPNAIRIESELKEIYGTKVNIVTKGEKGVLQLEYYGEEELNRLIEMLKSVV